MRAFQRILFSIISIFLCGFLFNTYAADLPPAPNLPLTPEDLFKEIARKLEKNDKSVVIHFVPSEKNSKALLNMKPAARKKFIAGLKKARFARKINPENVIFFVPYQDEKETIDVEMTITRLPDRQWIVTNW
jgi:hypothetical protein